MVKLFCENCNKVQDHPYIGMVGGVMTYQCDVCGHQEPFTEKTLINMFSRPTKDAPDLGESAASDSESKPAPKRVI